MGFQPCFLGFGWKGFHPHLLKVSSMVGWMVGFGGLLILKYKGWVPEFSRNDIPYIFPTIAQLSSHSNSKNFQILNFTHNHTINSAFNFLLPPAFSILGWETFYQEWWGKAPSFPLCKSWTTLDIQISHLTKKNMTKQGKPTSNLKKGVH